MFLTSTKWFASLYLAKQNNAELKPKQGFGWVFCVWFDDLEIKHKGAITAQETHYDPFGRSVLATTYQMASVHLRFAKQNNTEHPFGRSVLATTYQMASVHLRFAKQNNTELKTEIGFWLGVLCVV